MTEREQIRTMWVHLMLMTAEIEKSMERHSRQTIRMLLERIENLERVTGGEEPVLDARTAALNSMPYAEYLMTKEWAERRSEALDRAWNRCQLCSSTDELNVHHNTYERRGYEFDSDLVVLCKRCHERFHGILPTESETEIPAGAA